MLKEPRKMAKEKNELVVKEEELTLALAVTQEQDDFFSEMGSDDYNVPFTRVLADMSAVVKDGTHKAGLIFNTGSGEAVETMEVVLVKRPEKTITVRTVDGDFVASYPFTTEQFADLTIKQEGLKRWDGEGNSVYETWNYYILDINTEEISICPMLSSNYSVAKAWNTRVKLQKKYAPSQMVWRLSTKEKPNGKKSFWMFDSPRFVGEVPTEKETVVEFAKEMFKTAKVDHSKAFEAEKEDFEVEESEF